MLIARHHKLAAPLLVAIVAGRIVRPQLLLFGIALNPLFISFGAAWLLLVFVICVVLACECVCVCYQFIWLVFIRIIAAAVMAFGGECDKAVLLRDYLHRYELNEMRRSYGESSRLIRSRLTFGRRLTSLVRVNGRSVNKEKKKHHSNGFNYTI